MSVEQTYIGSDEWLMDLKEYYPRRAAEYLDDIPNVIQYAIDKSEELESLKKELHDVKEDKKHCCRAREEIEQVYKDNYTKNTTEYKEGFLDGLDIALGIIDKTLEESE